MSKFSPPKILLLRKIFVYIVEIYGLILNAKILFYDYIFFIKILKDFFSRNYMEDLGSFSGAKQGQKGQSEYYCENCDFICYKKYSWERHLSTSKHNKEISGTGKEIVKGQKGQNNNFSCQNCNKEFQTSAGLWKHKQKCKDDNHIDTIKEIAKTIADKDELIMFLIKENSEFKTMLLEQQNMIIKGQQDMMLKVFENGAINTNHSHNTTHTNSHNKAFNLNLFLNETYKDAMNITDFVNSIKLQLSDLEKFGEVGYVEGISNIITTNLKAMDVTQRPVHCTDKKRETMYIKDEDKWEKEDDNKTKLRRAIKSVANKNIRLLPQFRQKYPQYSNSASKISDKYDKMVIEAMGGQGDNDIEKEDKIIHNISKCTTIEKYEEIV